MTYFVRRKFDAATHTRFILGSGSKIGGFKDHIFHLKQVTTLGLELVELTLRVEEEFDISISDAELEKAQTPKVSK